MKRRVAGLLAALAAACGADDPVVVMHGPTITLNPTSLRLGVGQAQRLTVTPVANQPLSLSFHSADSCVATVSRDGVVTAVGAGLTRIDLQITQRSQSFPASIPVTVGEPAVLRLTIQSITAGSPPEPVNLDSVRGTVSVAANAEPERYAALELRLADRSADARPVPPDGRVTFTVNTAARDAGAARLYPNGQQVLTIVGYRYPPSPGCRVATDMIQQVLTLANP